MVDSGFVHSFAPYGYGRVADWRNPALFGKTTMSNLIEETLDTLYELRGEFECEENARAIEQIDEAIQNLEEIRYQRHSEDQVVQLCLQALGKAIRYVPWIARILESIG